MGTSPLVNTKMDLRSQTPSPSLLKARHFRPAGCLFPAALLRQEGDEKQRIPQVLFRCHRRAWQPRSAPSCPHPHRRWQGRAAAPGGDRLSPRGGPCQDGAPRPLWGEFGGQQGGRGLPSPKWTGGGGGADGPRPRDAATPASNMEEGKKKIKGRREENK